DTIAVCQKVKTIVMYGDPDFRKPPPDPDKDPRPVRSWLICAGSFVLFVLVIPWLAWEAVGPKTIYPTLAGFLGLVSALSWFVWFYSHQVSAKRSEYFAFSNRLKRAAFGGMVTAALVESVLGNKVAPAPGDSALTGPAALLGVSLLGGTVCVFLFFKMEKWLHDMRLSSRIKGVAARYVENKRSSGRDGLSGLLDAGVYELNDDTEIRNVCRMVAEHSAHPLEPYQDLLADVDLMTFFEYARDYGYDFNRHGSPDELVPAIRRGGRG
ncbi:MAG: hypothetical protein JW821_04420, partial [Deltaproteobacteria bacterium]|nr:hypothetical protein [Deltaproteobacteria bacterium]